MSVAFAVIIFVVVSIAFGLFIFTMLRSRRGFGPERDDQEMAIKMPYFRREVVEAKVRSLFPDHAPAEILRLLDTVSFWELELARIQLAILKRSKGDTDQLRRYVGAPTRDLINLIGLAEYPMATRIGLPNCVKLPGYVQGLISDHDLRQYMAWLKKR